MQLLSLESLSRSLWRALGGVVVGVVLRFRLVVCRWRNSTPFFFISRWCVHAQCGDFQNLCISLEAESCTGDEWDCPPCATKGCFKRQAYACEQSCWRICQCLALRRVWLSTVCHGSVLISCVCQVCERAGTWPPTREFQQLGLASDRKHMR